MTSADIDFEQFRDPQRTRLLIERLHEVTPTDRTYRFMEVCGTHTMAIARFGLRDIVPPNMKLLSGPGCPVCVTSDADIDAMIELARRPGVIFTTFGDMMRIPGTSSSLLVERALGHDIRVVYSPLDALGIAENEPDAEVVFAGVGFETTAPVIATVIQMAHEQGLTNFSVYSAHKTMPAALEVLMNDDEVQIDGLILPGHVSTIIGTHAYKFLPNEYHIPCSIAGFEPTDILSTLNMLIDQIRTGMPKVENSYIRGVKEDGNTHAQAALDDVFASTDALWRGLGVIPGSGLSIRDRYAEFDAKQKFAIETSMSEKKTACRCGDVLRGVITPSECPLFDKACVPEHPVGPCMVSGEGSCAAYYRYNRR